MLDLAVLAPARKSCVAVDLATNTVLRVHHPRQHSVAPLSVVRVSVAESLVDRPEQPEAIEISHLLEPVGRLSGLRCERLLRSIESDPDHSILGITGPGIPLWQLDGSRASVEIVRAPSAATITVNEQGVRCRFGWDRGAEDLPVEDPLLLSRLDWLPSGRMSLRSLGSVLEQRPTRMAIALSRPRMGYCYKVIAALLP